MSVTVALVRQKAQDAGLDPDLIQAIATHESNLNPWAYRFEPYQYAKQSYLVFPRAFASKVGITEQSEIALQCSSFGLMQIMGFSAREMGFQGMLTELFTPETGLEWACKKFKKITYQYPGEMDWVSAWNQGNPRRTQGGFYVNQAYCDAVGGILRDLRKLK